MFSDKPGSSKCSDETMSGDQEFFNFAKVDRCHGKQNILQTHTTYGKASQTVNIAFQIKYHS